MIIRLHVGLGYGPDRYVCRSVYLYAAPNSLYSHNGAGRLFGDLTTSVREQVGLYYRTSAGAWMSLVAVWLSGNALVSINVVALRRARLVLGWVTVRGKPSWYLTNPPRSTQPGHPSVHRRDEYWRWSRPSLGKKRRVLRNSRRCYQDYWHTGLVAVKGVGR